VEHVVAGAVSCSIVNHPVSVGIAFLDLVALIPFVGDAFIFVPYIRRRPDGVGNGDGARGGGANASMMLRVDHCMYVYVCSLIWGDAKKTFQFFILVI
jgi:hypothetical protein